MKLLTAVLMSGLLLMSTRANAQVKPGTHQAAITLGLADPLSHDNVDGQSEEFGSAGPAFGISYLYQFQQYLSLGGDFTYKSLGSKDYYTGHGPVEVKRSAWTLLAIGRFDFMPEENIRPYGLVGLGVGGVKREVDYLYSPFFNSERSSSGIAFALGGGADYDFNETWLAGAELRYVIINTSEVEIGASHVSTLDLMFKVGYKFSL